MSGTLAFAEEVRIDARRCSPEVHLVVRDGHVSTVLNRLAERLQFELHFESANDPLVSIDTRQQLIDLLALLVPSKNVSLSQVRDPRCPDQQRTLEVWVLPQGHESPPGPARGAMQATPQLTPEQARRAQEGIDLVLKAHGLDAEKQAASAEATPPHR